MEVPLSELPSEALLQNLYACGPAEAGRQLLRYKKLYENYNKVFCKNSAYRVKPEFSSNENTLFFSSPGRTEIIGNHTDHQNGLVISAAVDRDIIAFAEKNAEPFILLLSEGYENIISVDLSIEGPLAEEKGRSPSLIRGVVSSMKKRGYKVGGFNAYTSSEVLKGSGLSSSAAFELLIVTVLDVFYNGGNISPIEKAILSQEAENIYFGKPSGLMDQAAVAFGGLSFFDFSLPPDRMRKNLKNTLTDAGYTPVIVDTGGSHANLTFAYAQIPKDMQNVASFFGKKKLREVSETEFLTRLPLIKNKMSPSALMRAIHFYAEERRVSACAEALNKGEIENFLRLVRDSGLSSWRFLKNVEIPESGVKDALNLKTQNKENFEITLSSALAYSEFILGNYGVCRVHGGGFAGTLQAFVRDDKLDFYIEKMDLFLHKGAAQVGKIRNLGSTALTSDISGKLSG